MHIKFVSPEIMNMGQISCMMNQYEFKEYSWFNNIDELDKAFKKIQAKVHPEKFPNPEDKVIQTKRFQQLSDIHDELELGIDQCNLHKIGWGHLTNELDKNVFNKNSRKR